MTFGDVGDAVSAAGRPGATPGRRSGLEVGRPARGRWGRGRFGPGCLGHGPGWAMTTNRGAVS